jgi:hypothetical protein
VTVYVDDAFIPYRGMLMSHMIADTPEELREMAQKIGVAQRHIQYPGTPREHFDVCRTMRARAIANDAMAISQRALLDKIKAYFMEGEMAYRTRPCSICGRPITTNALGRSSHLTACSRKEWSKLVAALELKVGDVLTWDMSWFSNLTLVVASVGDHGATLVDPKTEAMYTMGSASICLARKVT